MQYLGDILSGSTIRGSFNTRTAAGVPVTLGGTPVLSVYKDGGTTETTTGVTLTVDFDSRTGHHVFAVVTSDAFYSTGSDYRVVITTGTVDGTSVVGTEVGSFSIQNRSGLTAAGVRSAIGLASANLDTQLAAIPTATAISNQVWASVSSQAIYVAKNGNDANSGLSPALPKLTIANAVTTASGASIKNIFIGDGDWTETGIVLFNGINVVASEGANFLLTTTSNAFIDSGSTVACSFDIRGRITASDTGKLVYLSGNQSIARINANIGIGGIAKADNNGTVIANIRLLEAPAFTFAFEIAGSRLVTKANVASASGTLATMTSGSVSMDIDTYVNTATFGRCIQTTTTGTSRVSLAIRSHIPTATAGNLVTGDEATNTTNVIRISGTSGVVLFSGTCASCTVLNSTGNVTMTNGSLTYVNSAGTVTTNNASTARISNSTVAVVQNSTSVVTVDAATVITSLTGSVTRTPIARVTLVDTTTANTDMLTAASVVSAIGNGSTLSAIPWNAAWDAEVESECADALNAYDPPTHAELTSAIVPVAKTGDAMALTNAERNAVAAVIEAEILNDATGGAVVQTIANAVAAYFDSASLDIPPQVIATAVRNALATELARIDLPISSRMASFTLPTNFAALGINSSGHISRVTLVDTTTTNTDMRGTNNALLASNYVAPANSDIAAIKAKTDNLPSDPADQSLVEAAITAATSGLATATSLATVAGYIDTEVAAIKTITDRLGGMIVQDGSFYQFTENALENGPQGSGGGGSGASIETQAQASVRRGTAELTPIHFTFPTASLANGDFTKAKRINGGSSTSVAGAISYLYEQDGYHWYKLDYDSSDRPAGSSEGIVIYTFTDGEDSITLDLLVSERNIDTVADDVVTLLSAISPAVVRSFDPITKSIGLVRGDSYLQSIGTAIEIPVNLPPGVIISSIQSARFKADHKSIPSQIVGTVAVVAVGDQPTARIEFAKTATLDKQFGEYEYDVEITYSSEDITILRGSLRLFRDHVVSA